MALENHFEFDFYSYFLNSSNHTLDVPVDMVTFHFYASTSQRANITLYEYFFPLADVFLVERAKFPILSPQRLKNDGGLGCKIRHPGKHSVDLELFNCVSPSRYGFAIAQWRSQSRDSPWLLASMNWRISS
jgi:hypothetical protein